MSVAAAPLDTFPQPSHKPSSPSLRTFSFDAQVVPQLDPKPGAVLSIGDISAEMAEKLFFGHTDYDRDSDDPTNTRHPSFETAASQTRSLSSVSAMVKSSPITYPVDDPTHNGIPSPHAPSGLRIKTLPNGMATLPRPLATTPTDASEYDELSSDDEPKRGGFGVRSEAVVPHTEGMKSKASDRMLRHHLDVERHRSRSRSVGDHTVDSDIGPRLSSDSHSPSSFRQPKRASSSGNLSKSLTLPAEWGANFWCIITDPNTQNSFFANPQTGECRWQVPAGTFVLPPNPDGEWWELHDEARQLPYYHHAQTGTTVWVRPRGFIIPLMAIQQSVAGRRFSRHEFGEETISALASITPSFPSSSSSSPPPPTSFVLDQQQTGTGAAAETESTTEKHTAERGSRKAAKDDFLNRGHGKKIPATARYSIQPPPPQDSPTIDQVLAGRARKRIINQDRELVAQALAARPILRPLNGKNSESLSNQSGLFGVAKDSQTIGHSKHRVHEMESEAKEEILEDHSVDVGVDRTQKDSTTASSKFASSSSPSYRFRRRFKSQPSRRSKTHLHSVTSSNSLASSSKSANKRASALRLSISDPFALSLCDATQDASHQNPNHTRSPQQAPASPVCTLATLSDSVASMEELKLVRRERDPSKRLSPLYPMTHKPSQPTPVPTNRLSIGDPSCLPFELQKDTHRFSFEGYAIRHFTTHRVGPFRRKLSLDKMIQWQKGSINGSLLLLDGRGPLRELQRDAIKIFKVIQRVMGDREGPVHPRSPVAGSPNSSADISFPSSSSTSSPSPLATSTFAAAATSSYIPSSPALGGGFPLFAPALQECFGKNASRSPRFLPEATVRAPSILEEERWILERALSLPALRDEIYVQTMKQLTCNPSPTSTFRGWQLMSVLVTTFPPSKQLHGYLNRFIVEHANDASLDEGVRRVANHCQSRLKVILCRGGCQKPPLLVEIQSAADAAFHPCVFSRSLPTIMAAQKQAYPELEIPLVLIFLCEQMIQLEAHKVEGVFRTPGDSERVTELKIRINRGHYSLPPSFLSTNHQHHLVDEENDKDTQLNRSTQTTTTASNVFILSSLLKLWLRELDDPLIPTIFYNRCISVSHQPSKTLDLVKTLPDLNRKVLFYLIGFLQKFINFISIESLSLIFSPNLFRCHSHRLSVIFNNTKYEQFFLSNLLRFHSIDPSSHPSPSNVTVQVRLNPVEEEDSFFS